MSRIGKLPITVPQGVDCSVNDSVVTVKGPKGTLTFSVPAHVTVVRDADQCVVSVDDAEEKAQRALWGMVRAMIANMVTGVTEGYKKSLEIVGVGYKFEVASPSKLVLSVGFSHKVDMPAPEGVIVEADKSEKNVIHVSGIDRQQVGYFASLIRSVRPPEPYKGKGIHYVGEQIRRKAGKTAGKK